MPLPTRHCSVATGWIASLLLCGTSASIAADVSVVGTGDGVEIIRSIAMAYTARNASTRIIVPPSIGSRGAIAAVALGHEALGRVTSPLSAEEEAIGLRVQPLARLPVAVITHQGVRLDGMLSAQLGDLFSGKTVNWKSLGGPDLRVKIVTNDEGNPAWLALRKAVPGLSEISFSERAKLATSAEDVIETVRSTPGAVGIVPFAGVHAHMVSALALDGKRPSDANYPAFITLGIIYRNGALSADAVGFVAFAASPESGRIAARFGAAPLDHAVFGLSDSGAENMNDSNKMKHADELVPPLPSQGHALSRHALGQ